MAQYDVTYTCGHETIVRLIGPHRSREQRLAYLATTQCRDCYLVSQHEKALQQAAEMELPPLVGQPAQVRFAESVRITILLGLNDYYLVTPKSTPLANIILQVIEIATAETSATQWLDWRHGSIEAFVKEQHVLYLQRQRIPPVTIEQLDTQQQALAEATLRPEKPITVTVAEIRVQQETISVVFPEKRDDFRLLMRTLGYCWKDTAWNRTITLSSGPLCDRVVELGQELLHNQFIIRCFDESFRANIVTGAYSPEQTRWIKGSILDGYTDWITISWSRQDDLYDAARAIKSSKYIQSCVFVPVVHYAEVRDFAECYGFSWSPLALQKAAQAEQQYQHTLVVVPTRKKKNAAAEPAPTNTVPERLAMPTAISIDPVYEDTDL